MCEHAAQGDANAIVGMRYDANEITDGSPKFSPTARPSGWSPPEQAALVRPECAG